MLRARLSLVIVFVIGIGAVGAAPAGAQPESIAQRTAGLQRIDGYVPLYWDAEAGRLYLEVVQFETELLYQVSLPVGVGSNPLGLDRSDPDAKDDLVTVNQLHVPVDRPVLVRLTSKDVIHSFGLNEMRVKQDAIPGMEIPVWFIPTRIGEYEITCSQLCGLGHYRMRGFLNVQSDTDFRNWLAEEAEALIQ